MQRETNMNGNSVMENNIEALLKRRGIFFIRESSLWLETKNINLAMTEFMTEKQKCEYKYRICVRFDFAIYKDFESGELLGYIEYDGEQHFYSNNHFGGDTGLKKIHYNDLEKTNYCWQNNIPLLRIRYDQIIYISEMIEDFLNNSEKYIEQNNPYMNKAYYYEIGDVSKYNHIAMWNFKHRMALLYPYKNECWKSLEKPSSDSKQFLSLDEIIIQASGRQNNYKFSNQK